MNTNIQKWSIRLVVFMFIVSMTNYRILTINYNGVQVSTSRALSSSNSDFDKIYFDKVYGYSIQYPSWLSLTPSPVEGNLGLAIFESQTGVNPLKIEIGKWSLKYPGNQDAVAFKEWIAPRFLPESLAQFRHVIQLQNGFGWLIELQGFGEEELLTAVIQKNGEVYFANMYGDSAQYYTMFANMILTITLPDTTMNDEIASAEASAVFGLAPGVPTTTEYESIPAEILNSFILPFGIDFGDRDNNLGEAWSISQTGNTIDGVTHRCSQIGSYRYNCGALDIRTKSANIYAAYPGTVVFADNQGGFGNHVVLEHKTSTGKLFSLYAHLSTTFVMKGQKLLQGQLLGKSGKTGCGICGEHLHFGITRQQTTTSGTSYIPIKLETYPGIKWPNGKFKECANDSGDCGEALGTPEFFSAKNYEDSVQAIGFSIHRYDTQTIGNQKIISIRIPDNYVVFLRTDMLLNSKCPNSEVILFGPQKINDLDRYSNTPCTLYSDGNKPIRVLDRKTYDLSRNSCVQERFVPEDLNVVGSSFENCFISVPNPQPVPVPPTDPTSTPTPTSATCDQSSPGIILYTDRNYQGKCVRLLDGKYNLADFKIDNAVSSIWINGDYTVKMWGGANQSPSPGEEFSKSDDNIDDNSLGEQWSSIEITAKSKEGNCPKDGRSGVYFYKDKEFKGACVYSTGDIKDFSPTSIGNNSTSSARIVGNWEVTVFDSQSLKGKTYKFSSSQSDLDSKADVGSDISSARVKPISKPDKPIPACAAPILLQPTSGSKSGNRTVSFSWGGVVCERTDGSDLYRLRIKTVPSMDAGGETIVDQTFTGGSATVTLDARWERTPLYWSLQVGNAKNGAAWASANLLTIDSNLPPTVTIQNANDQAVSNNGELIWDNQPNLSLNGSASDVDGTVVRVDVACVGQSCNETQSASLSSGAWSYQRNGLTGRNEVAVSAVDNLGAVSGAGNLANLTYWVDQEPPQTGIVLNNSANPANWQQWFTDPVVVHLAASDQGSGSGANLARAGVKELRYRLDGGEWQTQTGDQLYLEINSSGVHTLEYYALDNVGNTEDVHSQTIALDLLPPGLPTNLSESNGVVNDLWQNSQHRPSFMWSSASDEHSGVWGYQFYFGDDPTGEGYHTVQVGEPRSWVPQESGVTTGAYYLRGRTRDQAGNWSDWASLFTFRYDKTAPSNPSQGFHANGISSERWQRVTSSGLFTWTSALDEGAGVEGYFVYWGNDANGESGNFITVDAYQSATPLCAQGQSCSGYLRLRARDKVGNLAPNWSTAFVLRYDTAPPALDFTINGGASESNSVFVTLFLNASDAGSGVAQMQLSPDGFNWPTQWLTYTTTSPWTISGISGQTSIVYVRARDGVGNESAVVSRSIRFEANIPQPQSTNFVLFNSTFAAGGGEQISPQYWLHSTVAEPPDSPPMVSTNYLLLDGYEAGGVATTSVAPTPTPTPPQPTCNEPPLVIDNGAAFTGQRQVLLRFCAKQAVAMQVSDNAGFSGAQWESFTVTKSFTLAAPVAAVAPLYAYVRFRSADGNEQGAFADFIYFDATQPSQPEIYVGDSIAGLEPPATVRSATADSTKHTILIGPRDLVDDTNAVNVNQVLAASSEAGTITGAAIDIYVNNQDDLAGIEAIQLSERADFADATWQSIPSNSRLDWAILGTDGDKSLYARVQDKAGNVSTSAFATFTVDLTAPTGGITLEPHIVAASTGEVNIYLSGYDNLSGVSEMRLNTDPLLLQGDLWRPYTTSLTIPAYLPLAGELPIYVQFRDLVGNVSDIYSDTYLVDLEPPSIEVEVEAGTSLTRKLLFYGYDGMTEITSLRLSNDLSTLADVTPIPFSSEILWQFDERRVVWVQAEDRMGNRSEAIPVYADSIQVPVPTIQIYLPLINR